MRKAKCDCKTVSYYCTISLFGFSKTFFISSSSLGLAVGSGLCAHTSSDSLVQLLWLTQWYLSGLKPWNIAAHPKPTLSVDVTTQCKLGENTHVGVVFLR